MSRPRTLRALLPRAEVDVDAVLHQVRPVVDAVRERGVDAVLDFTERFDGVRPDRVRVPAREMESALAPWTRRCGPRWRSRSPGPRAVHADQRREDVTTQVVDGGTVTERWVPVSRVGLYAPGGLAVYPSAW